MSEIIQSPLVGVTFRPAGTKALVKALSIGDELLVERDADNQYDRNAVRVLDADGNWLGFIAKESNMELAEHLDNGGEARVTVISFLSDVKPHLEIELLEEAQPSGMGMDEDDVD